MSQAYEVKIADAIVAEMNSPARPWASVFSIGSTSAVRSWLPVYGTNPEETKALLEKLKVAVIPLTIKDVELDRAEKEFDFDIGVNFLKLVDLQNNAAADALSYLAEQVHEFYSDKHELATLAGWWVVEANRPITHDLQRMYAESIWDTSLMLTVRGWK